MTYHDSPHPLSHIEPPAGLTDSTRRSLILHSGLQIHCRRPRVQGVDPHGERSPLRRAPYACSHLASPLREVGSVKVRAMVESAAGSTGRIFISYRREETAYPAGWLFDRLAQHFGPAQIFKDVDSIQLGDDFVQVINSAVGSCDVLLALIGDQWLTITDSHGRGAWMILMTSSAWRSRPP